MLEEAIIFATVAHMGMKRKGKNRPYILHPLEVMQIVSTIPEIEEKLRRAPDENGKVPPEVKDAEIVLAAAVLHDTVEDTSTTKEDLVRNFGEAVAKLVAAESENKREELPAESTWQTRKQETIDHLEKASTEAQMICLGDKLANLREISRDYAEQGDKLWERFNQKDKKMHAWYYGSILKVLEKKFKKIPSILEYQGLMDQVFPGWEEVLAEMEKG